MPRLKIPLLHVGLTLSLIALGNAGATGRRFEHAVAANFTGAGLVLINISQFTAVFGGGREGGLPRLEVLGQGC